MPAVVAAKTLRDLKQPLPATMKELPKQVAAGLKILYAFQHDDGGWGWWREDDTDPYLTGAVLYGLALTQEAGYPVERERIVRGLRAVQTPVPAIGSPRDAAKKRRSRPILAPS